MTMITRRAALAGVAGALAPSATFAEESPLTTALAGTTAPGMAALVIENFRAEREQVAGVRRIGTTDAVRPGDRWHLGSDGKAITATLIAKLVERGALSWRTRLDEMLPDLASTMHADYRDVTLPDLLSHRSGLPENVLDLEKYNAFYGDPAPPTEQRLRYIASALADPPAAPKRADDSYSNTGFVIAGAIAERATGRTFEQLLTRYVFSPLGMRWVSYDHFGGAGEPVGHVDGRVADQERDANHRMFSPAGGVRMSLRDWSRFCIDHMKGEQGRGRLLSADSYRFLHTPQGETNSALGWGVQEGAVGRRGRALVHAGSDGNWYALVVLFPDIGGGALTAVNAGESMGGNAAAMTALRALAAQVAEPA